MSLQEGIELNVVRACWAGGHSIEIEFGDGCTRNIDFAPFLSASVQPDIRKYLEVERFKGFSISYGNLVWNDYDLCFSIKDLYSGHLIAEKEPDSMVAEESPSYGVDESGHQ